jgi:hypothetical protein
MKRKVTIRAGARFRYLWPHRLCHAIAVHEVDDGRLVVFKRWQSWERAWTYEVALEQQINDARFAVRDGNPIDRTDYEQLELPITGASPRG